MSGSGARLGGIFQNALASAAAAPVAGAGAGMKSTLECGHCGAPRERGEPGPLVCRYCRRPLLVTEGGAP